MNNHSMALRFGQRYDLAGPSDAYGDRSPVEAQTVAKFANGLFGPEDVVVLSHRAQALKDAGLRTVVPVFDKTGSSDTILTGQDAKDFKTAYSAALEAGITEDYVKSLLKTLPGIPMIIGGNDSTAYS